MGERVVVRAASVSDRSSSWRTRLVSQSAQIATLAALPFLDTNMSGRDTARKLRGERQGTVMRAAVVVLGLFALSARGDEDEGNRFRARLVGGEETPAIFTPGSGQFSARVVDGGTRIEFTVSWFNLTGNPAVAHVHIGQRRVAGAVSYFLCGGGGKPACPASVSGSVSGSVVAADVIGPVAQGIQPGDLAAVLTMMRRGLTYANAHTAAHPGGEIRGQLKVSDDD